MAEVWMGRRGALAGASKAVAIKLLARDVLDDDNYRQMFIEEARLSMLLTHSNVVQVFDVGEKDGECYMVMEWVDGLNLSELARKMVGQGEKLSTVVAAHVIGEVLRGLAYAHGLHHDGSKATIVHRDVSPQNVLVSVSGEVKLADFGVARLAREETSGLHVKGKLRYMAPEQLRGRSREPTVDLYAVGAILHELLEGTRFRQSRDEGDLYAMVLSGEYPPLSGDVPPVLVRLHAALLEPDPKRRIQSADDALELLYSWSGYRNSSVELARIVRKWIGVAAPRSGILQSDIVAAVRTSPIDRDRDREEGSSAAETLDAPTRQAGGRASSSGPVAADAVSTAMEPIESGPLSDRGATQTRTFAETAPDTEATTLIGEQTPAQRRSGSGLLIGGAMALALSFGVFGLGFPLSWWGGGAAQVIEAQGEDAAKVEELAKV
ncbi:MAG TPA: serine/threonine-protein kinase, partial [Enhygromyxa sp.]|nr:serine/threonine-protein kinase [Enhygromyxa sp.]